MNRNSTTLFLQSPGATTPVPWIDNAPDLSGFTEPTLSVLQTSWQAFLDSGTELEIVSDPEPIVEVPAPDWDGFNAAMLANPEFNQFTGIVLQLAPVVALGIPAALAQVSSNGVNAFGLVYSAFCQIGGVQQSQKDYWADLAESFNLPTDFVAIVRGSTP